MFLKRAIPGPKPRGEPILEVYGQAWNKTQNFIAMRSKKKLLLIPTFLTQVLYGDTLVSSESFSIFGFLMNAYLKVFYTGA